MKYNEIILSVANRLAEKFSQVYHSAYIVNIQDKDQVHKFPAIDKGNDWLNLSPADIQDTIYIRRNGDDIMSEEVRIGSCMKAYKMRTPLRVVYFNSWGDEAKIMFDMMNSLLGQSIKITGIVRDKFKLLRDESNGEYSFGSRDVYLAVDINIFWDLFPDTCDQDFCVSVDNPVKKCDPIIIES